MFHTNLGSLQIAVLVHLRRRRHRHLRRHHGLAVGAQAASGITEWADARVMAVHVPPYHRLQIAVVLL